MGNSSGLARWGCWLTVITLGASSWIPAVSAEAFKIAATRFSLGAKVGGPDEMQDVWTNRGYSKTGQNLTPGIVAVNRTRFSLGTIFQDPSTGHCYIAGDIHGNRNTSVIDFYQTPSQYGKKPLPTRLQRVGKVAKVGSTPEEIRRQLMGACGPKGVPPGESARDWLAGIRDSGKTAFEPARVSKTTPPRESRASMTVNAENDPGSGIREFFRRLFGRRKAQKDSRVRDRRSDDRGLRVAKRASDRESGPRTTTYFRGGAYSAR